MCRSVEAIALIDRIAAVLSAIRNVCPVVFGLRCRVSLGSERHKGCNCSGAYVDAWNLATILSTSSIMRSTRSRSVVTRCFVVTRCVEVTSFR